LQIYESTDYGGSQVTNYEIWMNQGYSASPFAIVSSYDTSSFIFKYTMTFAVDGIVSGKLYSFKSRAKNSKGYSDYSEIVSIAASSPPAKASTPTVDYSLSSKSALFVKWNLSPDDIGPGGLITGYKLYADDGLGGEFKVI